MTKMLTLTFNSTTTCLLFYFYNHSQMVVTFLFLKDGFKTKKTDQLSLTYTERKTIGETAKSYPGGEFKRTATVCINELLNLN